MTLTIWGCIATLTLFIRYDMSPKLHSMEVVNTGRDFRRYYHDSPVAKHGDESVEIEVSEQKLVLRHRRAR